MQGTDSTPDPEALTEDQEEVVDGEILRAQNIAAKITKSAMDANVPPVVLFMAGSLLIAAITTMLGIKRQDVVEGVIAARKDSERHFSHFRGDNWDESGVGTVGSIDLNDESIQSALEDIKRELEEKEKENSEAA